MRANLFLRATVLAAASLVLFPRAVPAQKTVTIEEFARTIQKEIEQRKLGAVALLDLADGNSRVTETTEAVTDDLFADLSALLGSGQARILRAKLPLSSAKESPSAEDPKTLRKFEKFCAKMKCDAMLRGSLLGNPSSMQVVLDILDPRTKAVTVGLSTRLEMTTETQLAWTDPTFTDPPPYAEALKNDVSFPQCNFQPDPGYTEQARNRRIQGFVSMDAVVSREGKMVKLFIKKSLDPGLDHNALNAVRQWRCKPARDGNGNPVTILVPIEIEFRLSN